MPAEPSPIHDILIPMDFSAASVAALEFAKRIAAPSESTLHLLYVDDDALLMQPTTAQSFRDDHAAEMAKRFIPLITDEDRERFHIETEIRFGTAYHEIEKYASETNSDLIVMGNIGRSALANALLGSVTTHVIRHADCPVLSVRLPQKADR